MPTLSAKRAGRLLFDGAGDAAAALNLQFFVLQGT
jgi:hypothetical protein